MSRQTSFPALLRKTHFATYDPLITRIYTSPTSSSSKGDWGLKYSLPPTQRGKPTLRNIKVSQLDSATGCDFRSGEKEGRFVERWGNGRFGWMSGKELGGQRNGEFFKDAGIPIGKGAYFRNIVEKNERKSVDRSVLIEDSNENDSTRFSFKPLVDLEHMSEERFERYLEEVRASRGEMLKWQQGQQQQGSVQRQSGSTSPSSETGSSSSSTQDQPITSLFNHLSDGTATKALPSDAIQFLSHKLKQSLKPSSSTSLSSTESKGDEILPVQHPTFGLAYASFSGTARNSSPLTSIPGRVLDMQGRSPYSAYSNSGARNNELNVRNSNTDAHIVGLGGLTATVPKADAINPFPFDQRNQSSSSSTMSDLDYQEAQKSSQSRFRITTASIRSPPTIVSSSSATGKRTLLPTFINTRFPDNRSRNVAPMETMDVEMKARYTEKEDRKEMERNGGALVPGEKGWVGAEEVIQESPLTSPRYTRGGESSKTQAWMKGLSYKKEGENTSTMLEDIVNIMKASKINSPGQGYGSPRSSTTTPYRGQFSSSPSSSSSSPSPDTKRSFSTSTRQSFPSSPKSSYDNSDKPTASISPEAMKGKVSGPGAGAPEKGKKSEEADGEELAKGPWRETEENVAGEVKYGKEEPEGWKKE